MIEVRNLTKTFGKVEALSDVSFSVPPGRVVGFLGPNGAGKSTAMRCLAGLSRQDRGTVHILGRPVSELDDPARRVGILLDAAAQHPGRTGRETLALTAIMAGVPSSRVDEVIQLVGLTDQEARRRIKGYSLGMRQRLGIAQALLGDPQALILDEPANGLDPGGIRWMRDLLRQFADAGGAVLLSSHLLNEVELIADDVVMIGGGRIVAQGTKNELLGGSAICARAVDEQQNRVLVSALERAGLTPTVSPDGLISVDTDPATVGRIALGSQVVLVTLSQARSAGLEELFLRLTASAAREGRAA